MAMAGITATIAGTPMDANTATAATTATIVIPDTTVIIGTAVTGIGIMIAIATIPAIVSAKQLF